MDNQQERPFKYLEQNKDKIISLYIDEKKSLREIAKLLNSSFSGVKRILHKYNIPRRNKCASLKLCPDQFNKEEYQIVLGSVLGDGHVSKAKPNGESQMYVAHGPKQKDYLIWKYEKLYRFIGCKIYPLKHKLKYKEEIKEHITWNFLTRKSSLFSGIRNLFYEKEKDENNKYQKIIPINLLYDKLDLLGLAVWYMDDGCYQRSGFSLCTESFTFKDNEKLLNLMKDKFNLEGKIKNAVSENNFILTFNKRNKNILRDIISSYVVPCMKYKII